MNKDELIAYLSELVQLRDQEIKEQHNLLHSLIIGEPESDHTPQPQKNL